MIVRQRILVRGVVQGVGFRPFVYNLAQALKLGGFVFNSSAGVTIEVEGGPDPVRSFVNTLRTSPPALSEITSIAVTALPVAGDVSFTILSSREDSGAFALVPPDIGTCDACWHDFSDPENRRYGYPFTNCTHCGPRYTIIEAVPYDRATTTMASFVMCADCQAEYDDPTNRRFHAQPNACPVCGPSLALAPSGARLRADFFGNPDSLPAIAESRRLLGTGAILAVKGLGGFLLACDATNDRSVNMLRKRKRRPHKPFALMARDVASVRQICEVTAADEAALMHPRRPIVVLRVKPGARISPAVAPGTNTLGVMLPYTPLHYLLFSDSQEMPSEFPALVMTSGNMSEEPIVISNDEALERLGTVADHFLIHNRDIAMRVDDSIVRVFEDCPRVLRRSRGFAPQTIDLGRELGEVMAFGAELKNTFCLTRDRFAILSQHIGDLENIKTMRFFNETADRMRRVFRITPKVAAHDLHPGYLSTHLALNSAIERKVGVQHHHAHIASCMAENHLEGTVLGVALDGTGYGTDGAIWGGEFLVADYTGFSRAAHLRYVPMPGGDMAVRQPWRMALSYLRDTFANTMPEIPSLLSVPVQQRAIVSSMLAKSLNTIPTSSCGRLFDAVAALVGLATEVTFEGQAAIALESVADASIESRYDFAITEGDPIVLDLRPAIMAIVQDLRSGCVVSEISARFHNTLSAAIVDVCGKVRAQRPFHRVCLSGGSFQNMYLLERVVKGLRREGFDVFLHTKIPANDGGIALGQAVIASEWMRGDI